MYCAHSRGVTQAARQTMVCAALLLLGLLNAQVLAFNGLPAGQKYEVVTPEKIHSLHKRDTQNKYPDLVQYKLHVEGKPLLLHLERTENLIAEDFTVTRYLDDNTIVTTAPKDQDHCCYHGHVKQDADSSLSICTCTGLSGLIQTRSRRYAIQPLNQTDDGEHVVYEAKDEAPRTCGVTNFTWVEGKSSKSSRSGSNVEKQNFLNSQKYVKVYIVTDKSMFVKYNKSAEAVKQRVIEIINYVNEVYKTIKTFVALTGLEIWEKNDQFSVVTSANVNLDRFSDWRKKSLLPRKYNDNAQFLTDTDFDGSTVGLAYVGTMCSESHSTGVIQDHSRLAISVGATVAHEMGHNLGMNHDSSSCSCQAESCIMAPSLSYNTPRLFSSCSQTNFQEFIFDKMPPCMRVMPDKNFILAPSVCGNNFTELGEDCDCGTVQECTNPCCDATTCKFKDKAECAVGECCENCKLKKAGAVCRPIQSDCDIADMCTGTAPECPDDRFIYNGYPCNDGQGFCYNGKCPMLQNQCTTLWGASAVVAEKSCFNVNTRGMNYGYCQKSEDSYVPCQASDVMCGVLYCIGGSDNPSVYASVASFSKCRAVLIPAGMVQNGTMCRDGNVCYNGKCTSINSAYRSANCSATCPGHGICDHELQCRCQEGWAPPNCDSTSSTNIAIIVIVVIIAVLLVTALVLMFVFRKKAMRCRKRKSVSKVSGTTNPAYLSQFQKSGANVSTPEPTSKNLLHPPQPPAPPQKPQISNPSSRTGYQGPQFTVTTTSTELNKKSPRPVNAPPPVPTSKPAVPTNKPVAPPPPKALKPPIKK